MKPSELLDAARNEIEAGHAQGEIEDSAGNVCSVGAIHRVAKQNVGQGLDAFVSACRAGTTAAEALRRKTMEMGGSGNIPGWNDRSTKEDVLVAFEKAAIGLSEIGE